MVGMKMLTPSRILLEQHYQELAERPFFEELVNYMSSGQFCLEVKSRVGSFQR